MGSHRLRALWTPPQVYTDEAEPPPLSTDEGLSGL